MSYLAIKHIHVTFVALSGLGFCLRGFWMLTGSPLLRARLTRIVPHGIDTILLGSALTLVFMSGQYPFVQPWLTAKVFGLLAYIVFGTIALKRGRTPRVRLGFFILALLTFAYIVGVALTRSPVLYGAW
ncbi:MAG TPA: SirB2 family protein [Rhodocyclaceae bacterium]|nr:SirB2 family protein [Rhodocyclaceae bacterium]